MSLICPQLRGHPPLNRCVTKCLVCLFCADGNVAETDTLNPTDMEANVATEVCLTVLDILGLFTQHHKVRGRKLSVDLGRAIECR